MAKIYIEDSETLIIENEKNNLLDILIKHQVMIENPCNGKGTCGKCLVLIKDYQELTIHEEEYLALTKQQLDQGYRLACCTIVNKDDELKITLVNKEQKARVLSDGFMPNFEMELKPTGYGLAVDIGTTTIALSLCDLSNGKKMASASRINSQKQYGLDVLTRITHEYEDLITGITNLQKAIVNDLNEMIVEVTLKMEVNINEIVEICVAANTTMLHMLLGKDAKSIGRAPYQPLFVAAQRLNAREIGLNLNDKALLYCLPSVSSFIGADIVAGSYVCELEKLNNTLFIDIGTNGEIVLVSDKQLISCSCAAGPALEGMNISSGMRAAQGAIEDLIINEDEIIIKTIDNYPALGLCGSGILAAIKELLRVGIIKKSGAFIKKESLSEDDYKQKYIRMNGSKRDFVIQEKNEHNVEDIIVSMNDVRQVQLAKGALLSGFMALINKADIKVEDIEKVIVAGQFGAHLAPELLVDTGILPQEVKDKISYVGNTSSTGAYMALMSNKVKEELEVLANKINYFELAESENYERLFTSCLIFPEK